MELMMIECCVCEEVFVTKNETGEHKCPKCDSKNYRYVFDEDVTEEELELVASVYKEIRDVFSNYGMDDVSNIKIIDLIMGK